MDEVINLHRTEEESTKEFANNRAATYAQANEDFNVGTKYGLALIPGTLAIIWWLFLT